MPFLCCRHLQWQWSIILHSLCGRHLQPIKRQHIISCLPPLCSRQLQRLPRTIGVFSVPSRPLQRCTKCDCVRDMPCWYFEPRQGLKQLFSVPARCCSASPTCVRAVDIAVSSCCCKRSSIVRACIGAGSILVDLLHNFGLAAAGASVVFSTGVLHVDFAVESQRKLHGVSWLLR